MKKLTERELERLLTASVDGEPSSEPPADLAERIKAEIPAEIPVPDLDFDIPRRSVWSVHRWRLAAVLTMVVGGGSLAWWVAQDPPRLTEQASAPETSAAQEAGSPDLADLRADAPASADSPLAREQETAGKLRKVPIPDPTPEAQNLDAELQAELKSLGYLGGDDRADGGAEGQAAAVSGGRERDAEPEAREELWVGTESNIQFRGGSPAEPSAERSAEVQERLRQRLEGLQRSQRQEPAGRSAAARARPVPPGRSASAPPPAAPPPPASAPLSVGGSASEARARAVNRRLEPVDAEAGEMEISEIIIAPEPAPAAPQQARELPKPKADRAATSPDSAYGALYEEVLVEREPTGQAYAASGVAASTGGTDEPNDQPYGDVFFEHAGVNPFLDTEEDPLSTFGLDVDTGSWGVVRRYLDDGNLPPQAAVRVEEIVNALDYGDRPPRRGDFALTLEGAPTPFAGGDRYRLLRVAVKAREIRQVDRKPAALTFVVDVSGSMEGENRLGLVKRSLTMLVEQLRSDDRIGLVIYGSRGHIVLEATSDHQAILAAIDGLQTGGSTNAEEGLVLGYRVASRALRPGAINRVILCSDGVANVGRTGPDSILAQIGKEAARGIELTTLGFGMGNYNDVLMERLADAGDGRYAYIDTFDEARRLLVEQLTGTLETVAGDARAQVELNPEVVERYRLLGYENRDIADERFRDDTVDAGEIGAGHTVTALYEVKLREGLETPAGARAFGREPVATLRLRWRSVAAGKFLETEQALRLRELEGSWSEAGPSLRLAALAAEFAEYLRGSYWAREGSLDAVFEGLQVLQPELVGDRQAAELTAMAGQAAELLARKRAEAAER